MRIKVIKCAVFLSSACLYMYQYCYVCLFVFVSLFGCYLSPTLPKKHVIIASALLPVFTTIKTQLITVLSIVLSAAGCSGVVPPSHDCCSKFVIAAAPSTAHKHHRPPPYSPCHLVSTERSAGAAGWPGGDESECAVWQGPGDSSQALGPQLRVDG